MRPDELVRRGAANVRAPQALRATIASQRLLAAPGTEHHLPGLRVAFGAGLALLLVIALAALPGTQSTLSAADAAAIAVQPATGPAPRVDRDGRLAADVEGVAFARSSKLARRWHAVGSRSDRLAGQRAETIVYRRGAERATFSIVAGNALGIAGGTQRISYEGIEAAVLHDRGRLAIAWLRDGHTCVLASTSSNARDLLELATR